MRAWRWTPVSPPSQPVQEGGRAKTVRNGDMCPEFSLDWVIGYPGTLAPGATFEGGRDDDVKNVYRLVQEQPRLHAKWRKYRW